jgi:hypothetical protein
VSTNYFIGCKKCELYTDIAVISAGTPKLWPPGSQLAAQFIVDHAQHGNGPWDCSDLVIFHEHDDRLDWKEVEQP